MKLTIHKSAILLVLLASVTVLALEGCRQHIQTGQIFIATQGGQNVKLGAVEILAFDEVTINSFVKQRQAEIAQQQATLQQEADAAQRELQGAEDPYERATTEYRDVDGRYNNQVDVVNLDVEKAQKLNSSEKYTSNEIARCYIEIAKADRRVTDAQNARKNAEIDPTFASTETAREIEFSETISNFEGYKSQYQADLNALLAKDADLKHLITKQQAALDAENQTLANIEAERTEKMDSANSAETPYRAAQYRLNTANQALAEFIPVQILLNNLPQPALRTVSDADGKFRLESPPSGHFAVFACAQRTIGETENYYWLVWSDGKSDLLLNNANVFGTASPDQVVQSNAVTN
jgi:hypothetical protein